MCKALMLVTALLLSAVWLQAQQGETGQAPAHASGATTIEGCLSSRNGHYFLTESDGTVQRLSGYANKLGRQVGRKVQITGKPGTRTYSMTTWGAGSSAAQQAVFEVKTVTRVADQCQSN